MKALLIITLTVLCSAVAGTVENPVIETVTFHSEEMQELGSDILLMALDGSEIFTAPTGHGRLNITFEVAKLPPSAYLIVVSRNGEVKDSAVFIKL